MVIDMHTLKLSLDNKYIYVKSQEKLLNVLNRKKLTKISNLQNQKKVTILVE